MRAIQQAPNVYLTLFIVAVIGTSVLAHGPGTSPTAAMEADKHQRQAPEMKKRTPQPMQMEMASEGIFEGTGEVIALVPDKGQIVIKHQEIVGFMTAMTMGYAVASTSLLDGLQPGDAVTFKIDAAKKKIIAIETIP